MAENDKVLTALANLFDDMWQRYMDEPSEDIEELLKVSLLVDEHEVTEEDVNAEIYGEADEGDLIYVLSDLGKQAIGLAKEDL